MESRSVDLVNSRGEIGICRSRRFSLRLSHAVTRGWGVAGVAGPGFIVFVYLWVCVWVFSLVGPHKDPPIGASVGSHVGSFNDLSILGSIRGFKIASVCEYAHVCFHVSVALSLGGPWVRGSVGPVGPLVRGSVGPWVRGSVGPWVRGSVGPWVRGSVGPWVRGSVGPWVRGSVGPWVRGSVLHRSGSWISSMTPFLDRPVDTHVGFPRYV